MLSGMNFILQYRAILADVLILVLKSFIHVYNHSCYHYLRNYAQSCVNNHLDLVMEQEYILVEEQEDIDVVQ